VPARIPRSSKSRRQGAPTLADVAARARYAPMTVSRVINGARNVSPQARAAVLAAIAELRYSPNLAARSLAGAQQVRVGMLYSNPSAAFLSELLVGALTQARESHAQLVVQGCDAEQQAVALVEEFLASGIDGLILPPPLCDSKLIHKVVLKQRAIAVALASANPPPGLISVRIDDHAAAAAMTRYMLALGHRRIGFICGDPNLTASACRLEGYRSAQKAARIAVDKSLIRSGSFTYRSGLLAAEQLLTLARPPTAIFAGNDDMGAAAVAVAHRRGLQVPKHLTVCGFDDTFFSRSIWPQLTTVHQPIAAMASEAVAAVVKMVMARRERVEINPESSVLQFSLVRRGSHGPPHTEIRHARTARNRMEASK
jgi:LacI family transcriptional regulator